MNSKIKSTIFFIVLSLSFLTSGVSNAASLSVCGEVTPPSGSDKTAYDNYKDYQSWLVTHPMPTYKDPGNPTAAEETALKNYYNERSAKEKELHICQASDLFKQIARIINFLVGFIGLFVIIRLVISGFQMVMSQGSEEALKGAKNGMTNAIIGLVIVFAAYLIVNVLFQIAGVKGFNINPFA